MMSDSVGFFSSVEGGKNANGYRKDLADDASLESLIVGEGPAPFTGGPQDIEMKFYAAMYEVLHRRDMIPA
jgi:hypothetical protein